jgi:hypothetical protein
VTAPTFTPEHFGPWTLREADPEIWPGPPSKRWILHEGDREAWAATDKKNVSFFQGNAFVAGPPVAAIERLLDLRRAAIAESPAPPSIAEDLKAPEPGSFEGAEIEHEINALADGLTQEIRNAAVREVLAELRASLFGTLPGASTSAAISGPVVAAAIDRIAARFQ